MEPPLVKVVVAVESVEATVMDTVDRGFNRKANYLQRFNLLCLMGLAQYIPHHTRQKN